MLAKDRIRYFSHDVDMRNDLKIRGLRRTTGNEGYAVWCYLLEVLSDTEDLCIDIQAMGELLAADFDVSTERLDEIVCYCIKVGLLQQEGNLIYSKRLQERFDAARDAAVLRSEKSRYAANKRWDKSNAEAMPNDANAMQEHNVSMPNDANKRRIDKSRVDKIRVEENREEKNIIYPYDEIANLWNETCVSLPKIIRLSDARREKVRTRLKDWSDNDPSKMLEYTRTLFERIEQSDFLTGRSGKWKGASFDWVFNSRENWIKVMEGNYDNKRSNPKPDIKLGVGEYINAKGQRTYGDGSIIIPDNAPIRTASNTTYNRAGNNWIVM